MGAAPSAMNEIASASFRPSHGDDIPAMRTISSFDAGPHSPTLPNDPMANTQSLLLPQEPNSMSTYSNAIYEEQQEADARRTQTSFETTRALPSAQRVSRASSRDRCVAEHLACSSHLQSNLNFPVPGQLSVACHQPGDMPPLKGVTLCQLKTISNF